MDRRTGEVFGLEVNEGRLPSDDYHPADATSNDTQRDSKLPTKTFTAFDTGAGHPAIYLQSNIPPLIDRHPIQPFA